MSARRRTVPADAGERILGVGVDLVDIQRVVDAVNSWGAGFTRRVFRPAERAYCESKVSPGRHYAARFAVKEAVSKALGTGIGARVGWRDIEVVRNPDTGAPSVRLYGAARAWARQCGADRILVSLSHAHGSAMAQAVVVGRNPPATG